MKILFIASNTKALGGIQQYNRKFLNALQMRGDEVVLMELKDGAVFTKIYFVFKCFIRSIKYKPNITICSHINYAPIGFLMKKIFRRKYIVCTHGIDVWNIKSILKLKALQEARFITTVVEYTKDKIVSQLPDTKDRIHLLYNPVDGARFIPKTKSPILIKKYGLENKKVIFTIARLLAMEGYKGYDRVIEAMPKVLKTVPNAVYLLAGKGDDVPRVKKLIKNMGLEERVIMVGFVSDDELVDYYNLADVFVMPSKAEGAPAVFVEALSCGIPVIAGNKDGSATPLLNGEVGLLVNPESIEEIVSAIINILTAQVNKNLLNRDFLRRKTLEKFGLDHFPQKVDSVMDMI